MKKKEAPKNFLMDFIKKHINANMIEFLEKNFDLPNYVYEERGKNISCNNVEWHGLKTYSRYNDDVAKSVGILVQRLKENLVEIGKIKIPAKPVERDLEMEKKIEKEVMAGYKHLFDDMRNLEGAGQMDTRDYYDQEQSLANTVAREIQAKTDYLSIFGIECKDADALLEIHKKLNYRFELLNKVLEDVDFIGKQLDEYFFFIEEYITDEIGSFSGFTLTDEQFSSFLNDAVNYALEDDFTITHFCDGRLLETHYFEMVTLDDGFVSGMAISDFFKIKKDLKTKYDIDLILKDKPDAPPIFKIMSVPVQAQVDERAKRDAKQAKEYRKAKEKRDKAIANHPYCRKYEANEGSMRGCSAPREDELESMEKIHEDYDNECKRIYNKYNK